MSHHGDDCDRIGHGTFSKQAFKNNHNRPLKGLLVIGGALFVLGVIAITAVMALAVSATSLTISGIQQVIVELWQTVNSWFQPITDVFNRVLKLAPGQE